MWYHTYIGVYYYTKVCYINVLYKYTVSTFIIHVNTSITISLYLISVGVDGFYAVGTTATSYYCIVFTELCHVQVFALSIIRVRDILYELS